MNTHARTILFGAVLTVTLAGADAESFWHRLQVHGSASQGLLFSSNNNWFTTDSSHASGAWTEGSLNASLPVTDHFRLGAQVHSYDLGQISKFRPSLDWVFGDYKFNNYFGVRAGRVKTPMGLFNDIQDIDTVYPWALLPQSVYPPDMRSWHLAHTGFVAYGELRLPAHAGAVSWQGYGGERSQNPHEGYAMILGQEGTILGNAGGPTMGADLRWTTPLAGLLVGASYLKTNMTAPHALSEGEVVRGTVRYVTQDFYAEFEKGRLKLDAEFNIEPSWEKFGTPDYTYNPSRIWYVMGTWRLTDKLTTGMYYSSDLGFDADTRDRHDPGNYSRETALNVRCDLNRHFYVKLEGHYVAGYANGFYPANNPQGLARVSRLLATRIGFTF